MKLLSVNIGLPREMSWKGRTITTGIFKTPVADRVMMRKYNLDGDKQADLSVHGGLNKAVYVYPAEHYEWWRKELPEVEFSWGMFGENLTVEGISEKTVQLGDRYRIGEAEVIVTQPRQPCYKLGLRFGRDDIIKTFYFSGRSGFYLAVSKEGEVGAGDDIELLERNPKAPTIAEVNTQFL